MSVLPEPDETNGTRELPGIYRWWIDGKAVYVGRYTRASRPLGAYERNVSRLLGGEPYRPQNPSGFRRIHTALAAAVSCGKPIRLEIVENCACEELNNRERHWIASLNKEHSLNGRSVQILPELVSGRGTAAAGGGGGACDA